VTGFTLRPIRRRETAAVRGLVQLYTERRRRHGDLLNVVQLFDTSPPRRSLARGARRRA
jgi:hypothetical protein